MARCVDQIEAVRLAVSRLIREGNRLALDRNSPLTFNVHIIKYLIFGGSLVADTGIFDKPIGKGRLPVVNVGDNAEVADIFHILYLMAGLYKPSQLKKPSGITVSGRLSFVFCGCCKLC